MFAEEMRAIAKKEFMPGMTFCISGEDGDGNGNKERYKVLAVYPNVIQTERQTRGGRVMRSFGLWAALKAIGRIHPVTLTELDRGEKRKDGAETRARDLLNEKQFLDVCESYTKGEIASQRKAAEMCSISHYTFKKYYAKYMAQKK